MGNEITSSQLRQRGLDRVLATWARLFRVSRNLAKRAAEPLMQADLSGPQFYLLQVIGADEGHSQQEYADKMAVTKGNICQHIDKLEQRGLLYRESHGKEKQLYLANSGRLIMGAIVPEHDKIVKDIFAALTEQEVKTLSALLNKLMKRSH